MEIQYTQILTKVFILGILKIYLHPGVILSYLKLNTGLNPTPIR